MRLKLGFETTVILAHHAALVDVASAIFAEPKKKPAQGLAPGVTDVTAGKSYEAALASMNSILKFG